MARINNITKKEATRLAFKIGFEADASRSNCAQGAFHAVSSVLGIKNSLIFKCVSALEGGGAITTKGSCGAFSGGLVALSYFFSRNYKLWEQGETNIKSSILGQRLYKKFIYQFDTIICSKIHEKILGRTFDLMDFEDLGINEDEFKAFEDSGAHKKCPVVVGLSAYWTVKILWEEIHKDEDLKGIPSLKEAMKKIE